MVLKHYEKTPNTTAQHPKTMKLSAALFECLGTRKPRNLRFDMHCIT